MIEPNFRDQCLAAGVPFFKQWGGFNKKKAGRILDDRTWDDMPALHHGTKIEKRWTALEEASGD